MQYIAIYYNGSIFNETDFKWNIKRLSGQEDPVKVCLKTLAKNFPHEKTMQFLELTKYKLRPTNLCKKAL